MSFLDHDQKVHDTFAAIEASPDTVGLTHAKILRDEIVALRSRVANDEAWNRDLQIAAVAAKALAVRGFGWALEQLKAGKRVARAGWNGKRMFLELVRPYARPGDASRGTKCFVKLDITDKSPRPEGLPDDVEWAVGDMLYGSKDWAPRFSGDSTGSSLALLPWIGMKTADDCFVPWLASQTDMLAEDWEIVA